MATSITIHGTKSIEADASSFIVAKGECADKGGWLDLVILSDEGEKVELTCYFESSLEANSYAAAINSANPAKIEQVA